jgi:hypothetical protein
MSTCINCNKSIPAGAAYCPSCGKQIPKSPMQAQRAGNGSGWSTVFPPLAEGQSRNVAGLISVGPILLLGFVIQLLSGMVTPRTAEQLRYNQEHWVEGLFLVCYWVAMWTYLQSSVVANVINTLISLTALAFIASVPNMVLLESSNKGWSIAITAFWAIFAGIGTIEAMNNRPK